MPRDGEERALHWQQEAASIRVSGTLSPSTVKLGEPIELTLHIQHPAHTDIQFDSHLTPFFFSSFHFERIQTEQNSPQEGQESLLHYLLYPLQAGGQSQPQADLLCLLPAQGDAAPANVRLALQLPPVKVVDTMIGTTLAEPLPLEPLPIALQGESLMLKDLHAPMQIASWQHNAEVLQQHGVPWGSLSLLVTGLVLMYGAFSWIKRWLQTRQKKPKAKRDAAEEVLLQLDQLKKRQLIETHAFGAYYSSLISTLRWYLNARFPGYTEGLSVLPREVQQLQEDLIAYANPIKFGREASTAKDCELALAYVKHCVYVVEQERNAKKGAAP